jgi:hypothetical protein
VLGKVILFRNQKAIMMAALDLEKKGGDKTTDQAQAQPKESFILVADEKRPISDKAVVSACDTTKLTAKEKTVLQGCCSSMIQMKLEHRYLGAYLFPSDEISQNLSSALVEAAESKECDIFFNPKSGSLWMPQRNVPSDYAADCSDLLKIVPNMKYSLSVLPSHIEDTAQHTQTDLPDGSKTTVCALQLSM